MKRCYESNIVKSSGDTAPGFRIGTCIAPRNDLLTKLGDASYTGSVDDKVSIGWVFNTPRGKAEVRDYWWNKRDEWSIAANNHRAALWVAGYLRSLGLQARASAVMDWR